MNGPSLSRRTFMAGGATALLTSKLQAQPAAVYSAAAFVDSVGVNTHLNSEPYASHFEMVRDLLAAAHIRHVRDELRPHTKSHALVGTFRTPTASRANSWSPR